MSHDAPVSVRNLVRQVTINLPGEEEETTEPWIRWIIPGAIIMGPCLVVPLILIVILILRLV